MYLKWDIQLADVLQSILIGYHLGNWNLFSVEELYSNTDENIYLDSLNTVSHQMMIYVSIKAFSSKPDLLAFGSYKIYKTYCFHHLSELGVEWRKRRKTAKCLSLGRTVWVSNNFLYHSKQPPCSDTYNTCEKAPTAWKTASKDLLHLPCFSKTFPCYLCSHYSPPVTSTAMLNCGAKHLASQLVKRHVTAEGSEGFPCFKTKAEAVVTGEEHTCWIHCRQE